MSARTIEPSPCRWQWLECRPGERAAAGDVCCRLLCVHPAAARWLAITARDCASCALWEPRNRASSDAAVEVPDDAARALPLSMPAGMESGFSATSKG